MKNRTTEFQSFMVAAVWVLLLMQVCGQVGVRGKERLVPGNFGELTDAKGNRWAVQQSGIIGRGSNSMLSSCGQLLVDNQQFYNQQNPMVTADQKEFVIEHANAQQFSGLKVTRRIRVMEKEGCVRFLEVFENPTGRTVSVTVEVRHQLGTQYKEFYSEMGALNPAVLGKKESGIYVLPGSSSSSYKPVLFTACSPGAAMKPRLSNQNQYTLHFHYPLTIASGQTVVIMHTIGQPGVTTDFGEKALLPLFKDASFKSMLKSVPAAMRSRVVNLSSDSGFGGLSMLSSAAVDGLGVDRGKSDVLALGESSRMVGTASCGELRLVTGYGEAVVPFEQVSAFVGGNQGRRQRSRVFLRDGQVYTGEAEAADLRFVMADGTRMKMTVESLDRLVRKESKGEGSWGERVDAMVETYAGDRIAISGGGEVVMRAVTPWGPIQFSLDEVLWISPPEDEEVGHQVEFKDGSRLFVYLLGGSMQLESALFGRFTMDAAQVRGVVTRGMMSKMREQEKTGGAGVTSFDEVLRVPHVILSGGQRIVGSIAAPSVGAITNAQLIELPPENIRLIHSTRDEYEGPANEEPPFVLELWGGSVITGRIRDAVIPVMVRENTWKIPLGDVVDIVSPTPRISDEARQRITALVRDLGNEEWEKRESAMGELEGYGFMAKALLMDALQVTPDAEVRRRIEQLMSGME